jgi:transposase
MAMGTRKGLERQEEIWYRSEVAEAPGHPFYRRLQAKLKEAGFDGFCEEKCKGYHADGVARPSLVPGVYFPLMLIGFFEGIDSERGIARRVADSLSLRQFLGYGIDEITPDHVTISRTRRLLEASTHNLIFDWVLEQLAQAGLVKGKTMGVDSTTLEADAAMKSIVRRDTGDNYMDFLKKKPKALRLRMRRRYCAWTGSARRRPVTKIGRALPIRKPRLPSSRTAALHWHIRWNRRWTCRQEPSLP